MRITVIRRTRSIDPNSSVRVLLISPVVVRLIHYRVQLCFSISSQYLPAKFKVRTVREIDIIFKIEVRYAYQ